MRTDKLMINADPEAIAAFKRALPYKVAAALTLVFSFAVIAVTAPAHASVNRASIESSFALGGEPLIDEHDFINPQKAVKAVSGDIATELERVFWMCDYATIGGTLETHEIEMCSAVTEQLRLVKFEGNFDKLLAWWRFNKETEHQALQISTAIGHCAQGDVR